jgi:hypothetical protein
VIYINVLSVFWVTAPLADRREDGYVAPEHQRRLPGLVSLLNEPVLLSQNPSYQHSSVNPIGIQLKEGRRRDRPLARDKSKQSPFDVGAISSSQALSQIPTREKGDLS